MVNRSYKLRSEMSFSSWWRSAGESSVNVILTVLLVGASLRVLIMAVDLDRLTTIDILSSPVSTAALFFAGAAGSVFAARSWFGRAPEVQLQSRLRRDRVGVWWLLGLVWMSTAAAASAWLCGELLGVGAQYLEGTAYSVNGVVVSSRLTSTPGTMCKRRLVVRDSASDTLLPICLSTNFRHSAASLPLSTGDEVAVDIKKTRLGRVFLSVEPAHK